MFTVAMFLNGSLHTLKCEHESYAEALSAVSGAPGQREAIPGIKFATDHHVMAWLDREGNRHDVVILEGNIRNIPTLYYCIGVNLSD